MTLGRFLLNIQKIKKISLKNDNYSLLSNVSYASLQICKDSGKTFFGNIRLDYWTDCYRIGLDYVQYFFWRESDVFFRNIFVVIFSNICSNTHEICNFKENLVKSTAFILLTYLETNYFFRDLSFFNSIFIWSSI